MKGVFTMVKVILVLVMVLMIGCAGTAGELEIQRDRIRDVYQDLREDGERIYESLGKTQEAIEFVLNKYPDLYEQYESNKKDFPAYLREAIESFDSRWRASGGMREELKRLANNIKGLRESLLEADMEAQELDRLMEDIIDVTFRTEAIMVSIGEVFVYLLGYV